MRHSVVERFVLKSTCESIAWPMHHFSMGCTLEAATLLPHIQALKVIRILGTHGNVSVVIPAASAIEEVWLSANTIEISIENWNNFAARMQSVSFLYNHIKGEGFRKLQTLHIPGDSSLTVEEHAYHCQPLPFGFTTTHLFSARRIVKEQMSPRNPRLHFVARADYRMKMR